MSTMISQPQTNATSATPGLAESRKAEWLNDASRQILELVERGQRDAKAKHRSRYDEIQDKQHKRADDQKRLNSWDHDRANGIKFSDADVAARNRLAESIEAQTAKIKTLSEIKFAPVLDVAEVESWLGSLPANTKLRPRPVTISLKKGQDEHAALLETQAEQDALAAKREKTRRAPLTKAEAIEAWNAEVERKRERGAPRIGGLFSYHPTMGGRLVQGKIIWPSTNILKEEHGGRAQDGIDVLAWLFPEQFRKAGEDLINAHARKYDNMLSRDERFARIVEIDAAILECQRREVELCRRLMLAGDARAAFRPGLSPLAILQVEIVEDDEPHESEDAEFEGDEFEGEESE